MCISSHLIKTDTLVCISANLTKITNFHSLFVHLQKFDVFMRMRYVLISRRKCVPHKIIVSFSMNTFEPKKLMIKNWKSNFMRLVWDGCLKFSTYLISSHEIRWESHKISNVSHLSAEACSVWNHRNWSTFYRFPINVKITSKKQQRPILC